MELRHVKYFVVVAEELHFGHAAKRLGISQPPLSQQIQALEREVGARLFERTKHEVRLTRAGHAMLAEAYRLLEQTERVRSAARQADVWNASSRSQPVELFLRTALRVFPEPLADPGPPLRKS